MFSPIVHGNLNIRGNRKLEEINLLELRKVRMIWNYNHLWIAILFLTFSNTKYFQTSIFQKGVWIQNFHTPSL